MRHQLARSLSVGAALATAGIVGGTAVIGRTTPAAASATSSSVGTPGSGSTDSSSVSTSGNGSVVSSVSASASTPASTVSLTPTPVAGSATQFSVVAGESATIIVDTTNGSLRIVTFAPHPGWFTVRIEQASVTEMSAQLQTDSTQVTFTARVADGALVAELASGGIPSPVPGGTPGTGPDASTPGTGPDGSSTSSPDGSSTSSPDGSSTSSPDDSSSTSSPDDDDNSGPGGGDDSGESSGSG